MMIRWKTLAALAVFALVASAPIRAEESAGAQEEELAEIKAISPTIEWVQTGGWWKAGDQEGQYRVVVTVNGFEHLHRRLFIQWISHPRDTDEAKDRGYEIVRTLEVEELGYVWTVEPRLKFGRDGKLHMSLAITRPDPHLINNNGISEKRTITVRPDGSYTFK